MLRLIQVNVEKLKKLFGTEKKIDKKGIFGKRAVAIAFASVVTVSSLTGCGSNQDVASNTSTPDTSSINSSDVGTASSTESTGIEVADGFVIGVNDTYSITDWDNFVDNSLDIVNGKINNTDEERFRVALSVLNVEYLADNGEKVLAEQFGLGTDVESVLNAYYSLTSQVREYNTEIDNVDEYLAYSNLLLDTKDQAILKQLESYAKEVISLKADLTDENKERIQEIFDIVHAFANGTGTIDVEINGSMEQIAEIDLSRGGILAAENVVQTISVMSQNIVEQDKREALDGELRSQDTLAKIQELIIKYQTLGGIREVNVERQQEVFDNYTKGFAIVLSELKEIGCTEEEAKALYTLTNIDYFVDSMESQNVFELIYKDGIDINELFKSAEAAVAKIVKYNDSKEDINEIYDMARLVMTDVEDAISLRALSQTAYNVTSSDANVSSSAVSIIKGYSQYSSEVTVDYKTEEADGTLVEHSLDKNALSKGATQIIDFYTYYSVMNHKSVYGATADAILPLVDGSQNGFSPYDEIVLMVDDYCADRNVAVYNYQIGENIQK